MRKSTGVVLMHKEVLILYLVLSLLLIGILGTVLMVKSLDIHLDYVDIVTQFELFWDALEPLILLDTVWIVL